jgi:hypothetical protein
VSEADQAIWSAILKSKKVVESVRELWSTVRWSVLGTSLFCAVSHVVSGGGYSQSVNFIIHLNVVLLGNEAMKLVLSKYELSIARAEAELAYRLDERTSTSRY